MNNFGEKIEKMNYLPVAWMQMPDGLMIVSVGLVWNLELLFDQGV